MNTPYGDPWSQYPQQPPQGPPPAGPPYGPPPAYGSPPDAGYPPYGQPYGAPAPPPGGVPFPAYGPPPPPPKSRTGLIVGLVAGAVALILLCGTGAIVALALGDDDKGGTASGGNKATSSSPTPTSAPGTDRTHKPLSKPCAPMIDVLKTKGLSLSKPREDSSPIGSVTLMFCSGPAGEHFLGLNASVYADDDRADGPAERAREDYDDLRDEAGDLTGTVKDLSGIGEKAFVRTRQWENSIGSLELSALDGNMTMSVRLSVSDMSEQDAVALASDVVRAYFQAA